MNAQLDALLNDDPSKWVLDLPAYQRDSIDELLKSGQTYDQVATLWLTATAENTFRFGVTAPVGDKASFLTNVKAEIRAYLCGDAKYKKERDGLFGEKGPTRAYVVSVLAVTISPHLGMAAPVLAPIIALVLASIGKITINAWCAVRSSTPDGA